MANYNIASIRAQVKTLLQTATEIANVYDYANPIIAGFPAIIFDVVSEESTMLDEVTNLRVVTFQIWILQEISVLGEQAAKDNLDISVKSIVNLLEKTTNDTLGNTVDWTMPVSGSRKHIQTPQGPSYAQELTLKAQIASSIL